MALAAERAQGISPTATLVSAAAATSKSLAKNEQAQKTEAYCDPASVHELLGALGISMSQATAASKLGTTASAGTAWYNGSSAAVPYPTPHVLNSELQGSFTYVPVNVDYTPTSAQKTTYKADLVSDINADYPLIGNADEVSGGPHLAGHPDKPLQHYVEVRGYSSSGSDTEYEDSIHGASGATWYGDVPAYSTISSSTFTTIVGDRGYIW